MAKGNRVYELLLAAPPFELRPNRAMRRGGWFKATKAKPKYRNAAGWAALERFPGKPRLTEAVVHVTWYHADRRTLLDPDNAQAACKALWDGLQDGGLLADDKALTHLPISQVVCPAKQGNVFVRIAPGRLTEDDISELLLRAARSV